MTSKRTIPNVAVDLVGLHHQAETARTRAYVPYSGFTVGAALLGAGGKVFLGANIENASYGLTMCAERVAVAHAVLAGERSFRALAVAGQSSSLSPCGACRQVLIELASADLEVIFPWQGQLVVRRLRELLPDAFGPENDPAP